MHMIKSYFVDGINSNIKYLNSSVEALSDGFLSKMRSQLMYSIVHGNIYQCKCSVDIEMMSL